MFNGKINYKWSFSIAMLVYQRVTFFHMVLHVSCVNMFRHVLTCVEMILTWLEHVGHIWEIWPWDTISQSLGNTLHRVCFEQSKFAGFPALVGHQVIHQRNTETGFLFQLQPWCQTKSDVKSSLVGPNFEGQTGQSWTVQPHEISISIT